MDIKIIFLIIEINLKYENKTNYIRKVLCVSFD